MPLKLAPVPGTCRMHALGGGSSLSEVFSSPLCLSSLETEDLGDCSASLASDRHIFSLALAVSSSMDEMSNINHNDNTGNCLAPGIAQSATNGLFISMVLSF